jgi:hypothetical protein
MLGFDGLAGRPRGGMATSKWYPARGGEDMGASFCRCGRQAYLVLIAVARVMANSVCVITPCGK